MALQMGMPRLDFYLNTSTGVLTSTAILDREQIGQYHLRIIAYDAGKFPRTSTSTLTVTGTSLQMRNCVWFPPFALSEITLHVKLPSHGMIGFCVTWGVTSLWQIVTDFSGICWAGCYHLLVGSEKSIRQTSDCCEHEKKKGMEKLNKVFWHFSNESEAS